MKRANGRTDKMSPREIAFRDGYERGYYTATLSTAREAARAFLRTLYAANVTPADVNRAVKELSNVTGELQGVSFRQMTGEEQSESQARDSARLLRGVRPSDV